MFKDHIFHSGDAPEMRDEDEMTTRRRQDEDETKTRREEI
jgi:hypothetical protein